MSKTRTKAITTTKNAPTALKLTSNDRSARPVFPLTWNATEYEKRKRWWWFIGLGVVAAILTFFMILLGLWTNAALVIAIVVALIVYRGSNPKTWQFVLNADAVTIGKRSHALSNYRAFTIEETLASKKQAARGLIVLLPRKRFGVAIELYLTDDDAINVGIAEAFETVLPYDSAPDYQWREQLFNRLARWLGLS